MLYSIDYIASVVNMYIASLSFFFLFYFSSLNERSLRSVYFYLRITLYIYLALQTHYRRNDSRLLSFLIFFFLFFSLSLIFVHCAYIDTPSTSSTSHRFIVYYRTHFFFLFFFLCHHTVILAIVRAL